MNRIEQSRSVATRTNDPARNLRHILELATSEFADEGFCAARIDEIAVATRTRKRMIYDYFRGQEGLYLAVLGDAYPRMRLIENSLQLDDLPPEQALARLVHY